MCDSFTQHSYNIVNNDFTQFYQWKLIKNIHFIPAIEIFIIFNLIFNDYKYTW